MAQKINFVRHFYKTKSLPLSSQRLVNMYAETEPQDAKNTLALFECAGLRDLLDFGINAPVYALKKMGNYLYAVVGNRLYQINDSFVETLKGTIPLTPANVRMSVNNNGYELVILTNSGESYVYNANTDTFAKITDAAYQLASDVTSVDGYNVFSVQNSDQFFYSNLRDATVFDALDFQTAEGEPDRLVAVRNVSIGVIWAFGERTIEIYKNTGGAPVFSRIDGVLLKVGCLARDSVKVIDETVFWLGSDKIIYLGQGYQRQKISTPAIDQELEKYSINELENCISFSYTLEGHKYYNIVFPDREKCFSYDLATQLWHERESFDEIQLEKIRWRANCCETFSGREVVGDYKTGKLYYFDTNYRKEGDNKKIIEIISSPIWNNFMRFTVKSLYIDIETGVGNLEGEGELPKLMFKVSNDGGRTYSDEIVREFGERGKYRKRLYIRPLGTYDNFTFKIVISDPVKRNIFGGYIEVEGGHE